MRSHALICAHMRSYALPVAVVCSVACSVFCSVGFCQNLEGDRNLRGFCSGICSVFCSVGANCHKTCGIATKRVALPQNVWHCHKTCEGLAFAPCCDFLQNGTEDALPAIVDLGPILAGPLGSTSAYISGGELVATGSGKISARLRLYANLL